MEALFVDPGPTRKVDLAATCQEQERVDKRNKCLQTTQRIKDDKTCVSFTPEIEQILVAQLRLMRHLHSHIMRARANDSRMTGVLPVWGSNPHHAAEGLYCCNQGEIVCIHYVARPGGCATCLADKTLNHMFGVAHPFRRRRRGSVAHAVLVSAAVATQGSSVMYMVVSSDSVFHSLMLIRCVVLCCSSSSFVQLVATPRDSKAFIGVACVQEGEPRPLLEAQVDRGLAHVSEDALEDLFMMNGKKVPDGDEDDIDQRTDLPMACIAAIKTDCTDIESAAYVAKGITAENPDLYLDPLVSEQALSEVLNAGAAKTLAEHEIAVKTTASNMKLVVHTRNTTLHNYLQATEGPHIPRSTNSSRRGGSHTAGE